MFHKQKLSIMNTSQTKTRYWCLLAACPKAQVCLRSRWAGEASAATPLLQCVNPLHPGVATEACPMFRSPAPVRIGFGLTRCLDQLPTGIWKRLTRRWRHELGKTYYYQYVRGEKPIPPTLHDYFARCLQCEGIGFPFACDRYEEDYPTES